ncbi:hypothetical protein BKA67DRAFT_585558, partial [Truncatella angustata]
MDDCRICAVSTREQLDIVSACAVTARSSRSLDPPVRSIRSLDPLVEPCRWQRWIGHWCS